MGGRCEGHKGTWIQGVDSLVGGERVKDLQGKDEERQGAGMDEEERRPNNGREGEYRGRGQAEKVRKRGGARGNTWSKDREKREKRVLELEMRNIREVTGKQFLNSTLSV